MNEIAEIIRSFEQANSEGRSCALITLVHVDGSSYLRPGTRMLLTEEGRMTGAGSGAETPEEIALLILAEVKSVFTSKAPGLSHPKTHPHLE